MDKKMIPSLCSDIDCTGCMACANSCNKDAISIVRNDEGFYRPSINSENCIGCGKCVLSCPIITPIKNVHKPIKVYAAWNKDAEIRKNSSSGGAFSALAETILEEGGAVVGAAYSDKMNVFHYVIETKSDLHKLRLSKYVQSDIGLVYREIKKYCKIGRKVLFCGTPCQSAGLRAYLNKEYTNVIICDFICHGVPSPIMLENYLTWLSKYYGKISYINFRDKRKGWYDALRVLTLNNGKQKILRGKFDSYWVGFNNKNNNIQESCYNCKFVGFDRTSDITIADYWGIGKNIPFGNIDEIEKGISSIIINTDNGYSLVQSASEKMQMFERTIDEVVQGNKTILHSCKRPTCRNYIYSDIRTMKYDDLIIKYLTPSFKGKMIKIFREYFPLSIIRAVRLRTQK